MRYFLFAFLTLCVASTPVVAAPIEIRAPGQRTISLALTSFLPQGGLIGADIANEINEILTFDLELTGLFSFVDPGAFLSDAQRLGLTSAEVDFNQWQLLGSEVLIKGAYRMESGQVILEARLFDVVNRHMLTGRRFVGSRQDLRRMAHRFADQVLKDLTGKAGPFDGRIAYIGNASGHKELYLMDVDGRNAVRLTNHRGIVLNPDFAPGGRELLFTSYKGGNPDLYRKNISSGREVPLSTRSGLNISGRYSPNGRQVVATLSHIGNPELFLLGMDGSLGGRLTDHWGIDVDASWNPKGDQIAFVSDRLGNPHIFIIGVGGGAPRRLTMDGRYNATPSWSPDGDRIAFTRMEGNQFDIYTIKTDGSDERRLTFGPGTKEHPRWSPDGRFLVYSSDQGGSNAIYIMRADGTGNRRISAGGGSCQHPAWSGPW